MQQEGNTAERELVSLLPNPNRPAHYTENKKRLTVPGRVARPPLQTASATCAHAVSVRRQSRNRNQGAKGRISLPCTSSSVIYCGGRGRCAYLQTAKSRSHGRTASGLSRIHMAVRKERISDSHNLDDAEGKQGYISAGLRAQNTDSQPLCYFYAKVIALNLVCYPLGWPILLLLQHAQQ